MGLTCLVDELRLSNSSQTLVKMLTGGWRSQSCHFDSRNLSLWLPFLSGWLPLMIRNVLCDDVNISMSVWNHQVCDACWWESYCLNEQISLGTINYICTSTSLFYHHHVPSICNQHNKRAVSYAHEFLKLRNLMRQIQLHRKIEFSHPRHIRWKSGGIHVLHPTRISKATSFICLNLKIWIPIHELR